MIYLSIFVTAVIVVVVVVLLVQRTQSEILKGSNSVILLDCKRTLKIM